VIVTAARIGHSEQVPEGDGRPFRMRVDACFTAVRGGEPSDVKVILTGEVLHGALGTGDALIVTHDGSTMAARCEGVTMSGPIGVIVSGIEKFDAVEGEQIDDEGGSYWTVDRQRLMRCCTL
jgi:hypothetical protein